MAPQYIGAIAIAAYSYMALVPVIQPPIIKLLTTRKERLIRMPPSREVSGRVRVIFPVLAFVLTVLVAPGAVPLLGMLFFGNLLKESGVTERLANTARNAFIDIITILLGFTVGTSTDATRFLTPESIKIFLLGAASFAVATASGVLFAKVMNALGRTPINPIIGGRGCLSCPGLGPRMSDGGRQGRPAQFPDHARHGAQRRRRRWICSRRRRPARRAVLNSPSLLGALLQNADRAECGAGEPIS
jgi:sodium ion-translocating decarboxylase beta subunit